jgi:nicotinate-nucleotide pyrophosphorylase (carboxylating)
MNDIEFFLKEDLNDIGDITSESLFNDETTKAVIIVKNDCNLAGLEEAKHVFSLMDVHLKSLYNDGESIDKNTIIANVHGPIKGILSAERLVLNILGRMSGIATQTRDIVDLCKTVNESIQIAATRKTTPGFRKFEKKAVVIGGGISHRMGLYDAILIKDNHLKLIGSVEKAIEKIRVHLKDHPIEIEVESEEDAVIAAKSNVDVIMLDNISAINAEAIAKKIKKINPKITIEVSGGITKENIKNFAPFSDIISLGILTHTIKNIDFSLEIRK